MSEKQNDALAEFWLHMATSALCDRARARIAVEIKAHYADLVEVHLAEGMPLIDARLKALEDLGDAQIAARRFRKQHLTQAEAKQISSLLKFNMGRALFISLAFIGPFVFLFWLDREISFKIGLEITIVTFLVFSIITAVLATRAKGQSRIAAALLSDVAANVARGLVMIVFFSMALMPLQRPLARLIIPLMGLSQFVAALPSYLLWRKFRRQQKGHDDAVELG